VGKVIETRRCHLVVKDIISEAKENEETTENGG